MSEFLLISEEIKTLIGKRIVDVIFEKLDIIVSESAIIGPLGLMDMLYERGTSCSFNDFKENLYSSIHIQPNQFEDELLHELWKGIKQIFDEMGEEQNKC